MTETELLEAIDAYTKSHLVMPTKICGTFTQISHCAHFASYTTFMGKECYLTVLGTLTFELDPHTPNWYLS